MELQIPHQTQQSPGTSRVGSASLPGTWKLMPGRAITLQPREEGTFKVAHGQVWATWDGPHGGALNESGDHFVSAGQTLRIRAGERLVLESANGTHRAPSYFSWEPLPARVRSTAPRVSAITQPLADLRLAIAFGGRALGRLVTGLAGLAWASGRDARGGARSLDRGNLAGSFNGPARHCSATS